jgi:hypothetical protein
MHQRRGGPAHEHRGHHIILHEIVPTLQASREPRAAPVASASTHAAKEQSDRHVDRPSRLPPCGHSVASDLARGLNEASIDSRLPLDASSSSAGPVARFAEYK